MEVNVKLQTSAVLPPHKSSWCPPIEEENERSTQKKKCLVPTALQAGRSRVRFPMVSLEFLIDVILPAALWL